MKVYGKKPNRLSGQHVNATHRGTQVFQRSKLSGSEPALTEVSLLNNSLVASAYRKTLTVKILKQRNSILS
jgi:hypothetical protein